eukprot:COSAG04_NODE_26693_length_291_cov_284.848958_2_plen_54_part_01
MKKLKESGCTDGEDEDSVTPAYAGRVVAEFQKIGARGISLLFASGDSGCARDNG